MKQVESGAFGLSSRTQGSPLLMLAAGGTGGHVYPAQAVAEEMLRRGWNIVLWTDARGRKLADGFPSEVTILDVIASTFSRGSVLSRVTFPVATAVGVASCYLSIKKLKPTVVFGFGGYPAFPPVCAAWLAGIPRLIHEQNNVLGKANWILASRVNLVASGIGGIDLPPGARSVTTGTPVRSQVIANSNLPFESPVEGPVDLFVSGGSQGANVMDSVVPSAVIALPDELRARIRVVHQARSANIPEVLETYRRHGISCEVRSFFKDFPRRIADAHVVVSRAGASSISEIATIGRPSILIPFAGAANDHQSANALQMERAGAAITIEEANASPSMIASTLVSIVLNPDLSKSMAGAAKTLSSHSAVGKLSDAIEEICRKETER